MILQSLYSLYQRLKDDPVYEVAPPGYSLQKITFKVVIKPDGSLFDISDIRHEGHPRQLRVPGTNKSSGSGLNPGFLWDNTGYMFGYKPKDEKPARTVASFEAFRNRHLKEEKKIASQAFSAVCRFLESWSPVNAAEYPILNEVAAGFGVFQIIGETAFVHQDEKVDAWYKSTLENKEEETSEGECLITGRWGKIAKLHPMIRGLSGGKAQVALVGFNDQAYESYGKIQSQEKGQAYNAPVLKEVAFEYSTALNALTDGPMKFKHKIMMGDANVVFWTDGPSITEDIFARFMSGNGENSDEAGPVQDESLRQKLEIFLRALKNGLEKDGELEREAAEKCFYLLALAPNSARLSVRFFYQGAISELITNLRKHYLDMGIERVYGQDAKRADPEFPPAWMLLKQTARDSKEIPPILSGPLLRAVIQGMNYPDGLYQSVMRRIQADRDINYIRACIIKGWLVRNRKKEVNMSLDLEKKDPAYRAGRLFAALEKTQSDALGNIKSTIRDGFYSSASATPGIAFPRLLRTYQHHLAKLEGGLKVNREKLVQEILEPMERFPAHLNLAEQGMFALGYYHQMRSFFHRRSDAEEDDKKA